MTKFLAGLCLVLALVGVGGYFYFIAQVNTQADLLAQKTQQLAKAQDENANLRAELDTMTKDKKTRTVLSEELLACQQGRFEQEYLSWPAFLRPDAEGRIEPVRRWMLSKVSDLNSATIVSFQMPTLNSSDKKWHFDVRIFGRRNNGEHGVNIVHFKFTQDSRLAEATEEPEW